MITKGIIKSIDLSGNTCTVHMPFFETAGNDPIIETATVSNTPGSYNGYKVGDVVYVAFEDGSMSNPVVIGKLYLGTEKEKADPRGVSNVEESTATKKATLPADASLAADLDKDVPNTTVPYNSLSSIANGLNTLNTDVGQMDRDYGNRFKQVISSIEDQNTKFTTAIEQTDKKIELSATKITEDLDEKLAQAAANLEIESAKITAEVVKKFNLESEAKVKGLGWSLKEDEWLVYAKDSVDVDINNDGVVNEEDTKEFPLFKVTRSGVELSGDLKLSGYSKDTLVTYTQTSSNTTKPKANPTQEDGYTWSTDVPTWVDGKYIWQKTTVIKWEYDKTIEDWKDTVSSETIVCLSGASAVSYWLKCSTKTHLGQQQPRIKPLEETVFEAIAMLKVGTDLEREDTNATLSYKYVGDPETAWTEIKAEEPDDENGSKIITHKFTLSTLRDKSLEIKAVRNGKEYARETIVFSPLNTPILVLSKDIGTLDYDSYGVEKIDQDELATVTATVYLNNEEVPFVLWEWTCLHCYVEDTDSLTTNTISIKAIDAEVDSAEAICKARYQDQLGVDKDLYKTFSIIKNKPGKATYKIDISNPSVAIPAKEDGTLATTTQADLPTLTTHSLSCYYGDKILPIEAYLAATDTLAWEAISDNKFRIKYSTVNVEMQSSGSGTTKSFNVQKLFAETGSILYELYRGTEKVATNKFEVAKQLQGVSATSYGVEYSAFVHRGTNQQEAITITAWKKFGSNAKEQNNDLLIRYGWRQADGTFGAYSTPIAGKVTIPIPTFIDTDLIVEFGSLDGETFVSNGESNIITYSPRTTPVLDLSSDSASLTYSSDGTKIGTGSVSSTATVVLDGKILSTGVEYNWNPSSAGTAVPLYDDNGKLVGNKITVTQLSTDIVEITCTATINDPTLFKDTVTLTKTFTITKQIQGGAGVNIVSQTTYYALISDIFKTGDIAEPETADDLRVIATDGHVLAIGTQTLANWSTTPPEHTADTIANGWKYWTTVETVFSSGTSDFSEPIIDEALSGVYELAQGKTTNYYSALEPTKNPSADGTSKVYKRDLKVGDCWFDISYKEISATELATLDIASKYINYYVGSGTTKTLVTRNNYSTLEITPKSTQAYTRGVLKQCISFKDDGSGDAIWEDIGGELVTNKITANYINALDITAKKIEVPGLFTADGLASNPNVQIAGFNVEANTLTTGTVAGGNLIKLNSDSTVQYLFSQLEDQTLLETYVAANPPIIKAFRKAESLWTSTRADNKPHLAYYVTNANFEGNRNGYGVTKITFTNKVSKLKLYIKTTSNFTSSDFIVVSTLNAAKAPGLPVGDSSYAKADTFALNSGTVVEAEYTNVKAGDYIYVTYRTFSGQANTSYGGYIYLPVDTRMTIGDNFKVLADGSVYANNLFLGGTVQEGTDPSTFGGGDASSGNAGQFTAARVEVIDKSDSLNHKILLKADGRAVDEYGDPIATSERVQIGGFTVTGNTLTSGHSTAGNEITLNSNLYYEVKNITKDEFLDLLDTAATNIFNNNSSLYKYYENPLTNFKMIDAPTSVTGDEAQQLMYVSTNIGTHASFSVAKIVFTQELSTFNLYLHSGKTSGSTHDDYMWASVLNPAQGSCDFGLNRTNNTLNRGCQGLTRGKADTLCTVTYNNINKGNYIYIAYIKGTSTNNEPTSTADDIGSFYMPLNIQSSRLKIGNQFEVMSDGTTYASSLYLDRESGTQTVKGQLDAISATLNHLEVKTTGDTPKTIFKAEGRARVDGVTVNDNERVQIGGFKVTDTTIKSADTDENIQLNSDGSVKFNSGDIGGWNINSTHLKKNGTGLCSAVTEEAGATLDTSLIEDAPDSPIRFYAGGTEGDLRAASFKVLADGTLYATAANIEGTIKTTKSTIGNLSINETSISTTAGTGSDFAIDLGTGAIVANNLELYNDFQAQNILAKRIQGRTVNSPYIDFEGKAAAKETVTVSASYTVTGSGDRGLLGGIKDAGSVKVTITAKVGDTVTALATKRTFTVYANYTATNYSKPAYNSVSKTVTIEAGSSSAEATFVNLYDWSKTVSDSGASHTYNYRGSCSGASVSPSSWEQPSLTAKITGITMSANMIPGSTGLSIGASDNGWKEVYATTFHGALHANTCTCTSSDLKAKNTIEYDISKYDPVFDTLRPVSYKYNNASSDRTHLGFIAQDVQTSIKQAGLTDKDYSIVVIEGEGFDAKQGEVIDEEKTNYYIRYEQLHALEVRQIQLLKQEVKELKAEIAELKKLKT